MSVETTEEQDLHCSILARSLRRLTSDEVSALHEAGLAIMKYDNAIVTVELTDDGRGAAQRQFERVRAKTKPAPKDVEEFEV